MSDNDLSGEIPSGLANFRDMKDLRFRRNPRLGGHWPMEFWENSYLNWFDIRGCNTTGTLGPSIGRMENLVFFRISGNRFNGTVPKEIANLMYLRSFWLDKNDITGTMPQEICNAQTHQAFSDMNADCLGDDPEIDCPCCTGCCSREGECKKMDA